MAADALAEDAPVPLPTLVKSENETKLPKTPMIVLCIAVTTEFLTANISMPFLLFMVANFKDIGSPDPGAASGILVSLLFVSQFFTSLLWASLADKFGARPILSISMLGAAFSTMAFGFCTTLRAAIIVRLIHGGFLGAVGVGRATVSVVANPSNEARAYSIVAFCWSMGGVLAAILGGSLESPTVHFPWLRAFVVLEVYPYCLPCIAAALLPLFGGLLALTLANDGGPRQGRLQLAGSEAPLVSEVDVRATLHPPDTIANRRPSLSPQTSLRAYPTFRGRVSSVTSMVAQARKGSIAATLYGPANDERAPELQDMSELNLAQKLLMANEGLPSLSNLWFQAAIAADNEEVFENDLSNENSQAVDDGELSVDPFPLQSSTQGHIDQRRYSSTSQRRGSIFRREDQHADQEVQLPTIFQNSGLEAPAALIVDLPADVAPSATTAALVSDPGLQTVTEGEALEIEPEPEVPVAAKPSSVFTLLPKQIIAQFALLALHTTVHDQVFYLYLVSEYENGGLGLSPANFSQIIALMTFAQIFCQFVIYPRLGPPTGVLSHLSMFRLGTLLYIPAYLSITAYRQYTGDTALVIGLLAISTAVRFAAVVFSYTAISVLLNYSSPPHIVGLSNGISQSLVSAARFIGPLSGGIVWAASTKSSAAGYPIGFIVCGFLATFALGTSFFIR